MSAGKLTNQAAETARRLRRQAVDAIYHGWLGPARSRIAARRLRREMEEARGAPPSSAASNDDATLTVVLRMGGDPVRTSFCLHHLFRASRRRIELRIVSQSGDGDLELATSGWPEDWERRLELVPSHVHVAASHTARCVLLLSDKVAPDPAALGAACDEIERENGADVLVPRLHLPHGGILSAGGMLIDGDPIAYGRWSASARPAIMFRREVDYGSTDLLLLSADAFTSIAPSLDSASGDEEAIGVGVCRQLREHNYRLVYEPDFSGLFLAPTISAVAAAPASKPAATILRERDRAAVRGRILMIEDRVPHVWLGAGFPRSQAIVNELLALGYFVTFYPTHDVPDWWPDVRKTLDPRVEVMLGAQPNELRRFLRARFGYYDACIVSRPHNMRAVKATLMEARSKGDRMRLIYDAEAIFAVREVVQRRMRGEIVSNQEEAQAAKEEVALTQGCDAVLTVSGGEAAHFNAGRDTAGARAVHVLSYVVTPNLTAAAFEERSGFLFVGGIHDLRWPNADALRWFVDDVLPLLRRELGAAANLSTVGLNLTGWRPETVDGVKALGVVDDLTDVYGRARVFIAPTRFAAGIPLKIYGAAAAGVPVVATSLLASQLGWRRGTELCVADTAEEFARACAELHSDKALWQRLREAAFARVSDECSEERFRDTLEAALGSDQPAERRSPAVARAGDLCA